MARSDDDSWGITEGVGATALAMALARAGEARAEHPLFSDPLAQVFLDAAVALGWQYPYDQEALTRYLEANPQIAAQLRGSSGYTASRTKFFDDFFIRAAGDGVRQAVILAAGLDSRAWRLPWPDGTVVFEVDQPEVLEFKNGTLEAHGAIPSARYVSVPIDLRANWPDALRESGFDPDQSTAWAAEGLLPYLSGDAQDLLFERIHGLSAPGSRVAVEAFGPKFFDRDLMAARRAKMQQFREAAKDIVAVGMDIDTEQLFFFGPRADVGEWLRDHHWNVTAIEAGDLMASYGRPAPAGLEDAAMPSVFVEGRLDGVADGI